MHIFRKAQNLLLCILAFLFFSAKAQDDDYMWLEEVEGVKALEFVKTQNKLTLDRLSRLKEYPNIYAKSLAAYNSTERIPIPTIHGEFVYNMWQDEDHVRGIWRRSSIQSFASGKPEWSTVLDLDELSKKENVNWVFKDAQGLYPSYDRFLVYLSKGGGDAAVIREFDVVKGEFVADGFMIAESKGSAFYLDANTLIFSDALDKSSVTQSGLARQIKIWKRGTSITEARLIFEGEPTDAYCVGIVEMDGPASYVMISRGLTRFSINHFVWINDELKKLDIPDDCKRHVLFNDQLVIELKSDWHVNGNIYKQGELISLDFPQLIKGNQEIQSVFKPDEFTSITSILSTQNKMIVNLLTNVKSELYIYSFVDDKWMSQRVNAPDFGTITLRAADLSSDDYFFTFANFLTPSTLLYGDARQNTIAAIKSLPDFFDGSKYKVEQLKATSRDGTLVPYFIVSSKSAKANGKNPTLLYAYGGFEISSLPTYLSAVGSGWLENGGTYVVANIRGGGEFGPKWHQAALKEKRQNSFDDFHAVAQDLIRRKITSSKNLGIWGGSNGGLLVGVAFTQRPDLYNAVVCAAPLLDMQRYNKLFAGALWTAEYGDPDKPEDWEYIKKYSPYHNLRSGKKYPEVLFYASGKDDRVHPGHARKMAASMIDMGYSILYYENTEGGHTGPVTNEQRAQADALRYSYLLMKLK